LAFITQVVSPQEGHSFHNRLTHVLQVAQVGRHLARKLLASHPPDAVERLGGLDPDVVEAAALAHDLGHPPFGHVAEGELDRLAREAGEPDGFESNAQSFRLITRLEVRESESSKPGLNLTRATLDAVLKYPWFRGRAGIRDVKWGAYRSERDDFAFARAKHRGHRRSVEAQLMDWADDIAYSVHDLDDFVRANRIPLWKISTNAVEQGRFLERAFERKGIGTPRLRSLYEKCAETLFRRLPFMDGPFEGRREQIASIRAFTSRLLQQYEDATTLGRDGLFVPSEVRAEVTLLKQLVWHYVIETPALATQRHGQRHAISELFRTLLDALSERRFELFPVSVRERLSEAGGNGVREMLDFISGLTEQQASALLARLTGRDISSPLRWIAG